MRRLFGKKLRIWCIRGKHLALAGCVLAAAVMFWVVNHPAIVGASAATRELPIYCVQRDQKMAALSFDAAWGNDIMRSLSPSHSGGWGLPYASIDAKRKIGYTYGIHNKSKPAPKGWNV